MEQHLHREIDELKVDIAKLGGLVEDSIGKALTALRQGSKKLAKEVRRGDNTIDAMEVAVEERVMKMLALYQPVARDLRFLVTALKVNNELEHMGDLAESIAAKVKSVQESDVENSSLNLFEMAEKTQHMVHLAMDAFLKKDSQLARHIIKLDDEVDEIHRHNHKVIRKFIKNNDGEFCLPELSLLSVSRCLERIGDMASSIAEDVIYFVDAIIVRHRPHDEMFDD